jgi:hypothetical protein
MQGDDEAAQAYAKGREKGLPMGIAVLVQTLLRHVISTADDPDAVAQKLKRDAETFALALHDGTGIDGPEVAGFRDGAIEQIAEFFMPSAPRTRQ